MGYAGTYDELTPEQGKLLAGIVALAEKAGGEPKFVAHKARSGYAEFFATVDRAEVHTYESDWLGTNAGLKLFEELNLIHIQLDDTYESVFFLRQAALDYPKWGKWPTLIRSFLVKWDSWESDMRGGVITIVTSVGASLLFTLLVNLLFG